MTSVTQPSAGQGLVQRTWEGVGLTVYGHSYTQIPAFVAANGYVCNPNAGEWPLRVAQRLGMGLQARGAGGSLMADLAFAAIGAQLLGGSLKTWTNMSGGVVVIEAETNEIANGTPSSALYQNVYKQALRALIATLQAGSRIESSAASSVNGTWSTSTTADFSGGSMRQSPTVGAWIEFTGVSAPAGFIHVLTFANDNSNPIGTFDVSVDGVSQGVAYNGQNTISSYSAIVGSRGYVHYPLKIVVPSTGTHTIRITKTDAGATANIIVDSLLVPSLTPPLILVCKDPPSLSTKTAAIGGTVAAAYTAWAPTFHGIIDTVCSEFGTYAVDLASGWDTSTMISSRDTLYQFHPNDPGMAQIATNVVAAIQARTSPTTSGVQVL